jgi:hypothetical protein
MMKEGGLIEDATAIVYFVSFLVSLLITITFYRRKLILYSTLYFLLSIGLFFICMEEISWGQRFLGVGTPQFFAKYNYQNEINLHNIEGFPLHLLYIIVGCYGGFARFFLPRKVKSKYGLTVNFFVPDYFLFFYFFSVGALYLYYDYFSSIVVSLFGDQFGWGVGHFIRGKDQEPAEFLLSCGFLLFLIVNRYRQIGTETFEIVTTGLPHAEKKVDK